MPKFLLSKEKGKIINIDKISSQVENAGVSKKAQINIQFIIFPLLSFSTSIYPSDYLSHKRATADGREQRMIKETKNAWGIYLDGTFSINDMPWRHQHELWKFSLRNSNIKVHYIHCSAYTPERCHCQHQYYQEYDRVWQSYSTRPVCMSSPKHRNTQSVAVGFSTRISNSCLASLPMLKEISIRNERDNE